MLGGGGGGDREHRIKNIRNNRIKISTHLSIFFLFIWFYRKHSAFSPPVWKINAKFMVTTQKMCRTHTKWWPPYTCPRAISLKPWKLTKRCLFLYIYAICTSLRAQRLVIFCSRNFNSPLPHVLFSLLTSTISSKFSRLLFLVSWHRVSRFGERSQEGQRYRENDWYPNGVRKNGQSL